MILESSAPVTSIAEHRTRSIDREELAAKTGYGHLGSKGFVNAMGRLRTLGLFDYPASGKVQGTQLLFFPHRGR